jgi:hypothetical protein
MNLYKISQEENSDNAFYDSAIICAEDEKEARTICPNGRVFRDGRWWEQNDNGIETEEISNGYLDCSHVWTEIENVKVEYIGKADDNIKRGVILSSFNHY